MSAALRSLLFSTLIIGWLGCPALTLAAKPVFSVEDHAGLFSKDAVEKANGRITQIERETGKSLLIETINRVPEKDREQVKTHTGREKYFERYAEKQTESRAVLGIYVLICKDPRWLEVYSNVKGVGSADRLRVKERLQERLHTPKDEHYDDALQGLVADVREVLEKAHTNASEKQRGGHNAPVPDGGFWGGGLGKWLCLGLVGLLVVWILFAVVRALSGGRGYGGGGYGGGYGGGGGGFLPSLLGGMFGAAAGMWVYDSLFRTHHTPDLGSGTPYGTPTETTDVGGTGGEWGTDEGNVATGAEGGDWADGGDTGGDVGGGDFGGGDFDGGDGGDW